MDIRRVRDRLTRKYVGKHGIHGCEVRKRHGTEYLTIVHVPSHPLSWELRREIRRIVGHFDVEFIAEKVSHTK
jgi:hypothetical protein